MNRSDASSLLNRTARQWPGKTTVNREVLDAWTNALADMPAEAGDAAWHAHVRDCPHPATPADLWAAHRRLAATTTPATPRPELGPPSLELPPAHHRPDIAHAELARARAILRGAR